MIEKRAYAKINLSLEVLGKRSDGYHDIASVMQLVSLHDTLTLAPAGELRLVCDNLPGECQNNLVMRAARSLLHSQGVNKGARITLHKAIPISSGLAGGSSDAAATLLGLCELWGVKPPKQELLGLASGLGSDVPFFLNGPTALVEGRGERITPIASPSPMWVVLVCPFYNLPDKTRHLYEKLAAGDITGGSTTQRLVSSLQQGRYPGSGLLRNAFERASFAVFEGLDALKQKMEQAGVGSVHLSGSGPTLYSLFPGTEHEQAQTVYHVLRAAGLNSFLVSTLL